MRSRTLLVIGITTTIVIIAIIVAAVAFAPDETNPAFTTAVMFVESAGKQADAAAMALLNDPMRAYVEANCAGGLPSGCIGAYIPADWGDMLSAVFRRAAPNGENWNVEVISTYEAGKGASGMCALIYVEPDGSDGWDVAGWAGFVH